MKEKPTKRKKRKRIPVRSSKSVMIESRLAVEARNGNVHAQNALMGVISF